MDINQIRACASKIANVTDTDILLFNGPMKRPHDLRLMKACRAAKRRKNVMAIVVTDGGDADVAYRIGRFLQDKYDRITAFVPGYCKSAGTLLAIAANEIVMTDEGELGPLDVQLVKVDDLFQRSSGLTVTSAFNSLQVRAMQMFEESALRIKRGSGGQITFKTAAEMSSRLTIGLLSSIYSQIDPSHVGESARAMQIAEDYGRRLDEKPDNLEPDALAQLAGSYSSHTFTIDRRETSLLFRRVRPPSPDEQSLADLLEHIAIGQVKDDGQSVCEYLSNEPIGDATAKTGEETHEPAGHDAEDQAPEGAGPATGETAGGADQAADRKPQVRIVGGN